MAEIKSTHSSPRTMTKWQYIQKVFAINGKPPLEVQGHIRFPLMTIGDKWRFRRMMDAINVEICEDDTDKDIVTIPVLRLYSDSGNEQSYTSRPGRTYKAQDAFTAIELLSIKNEHVSWLPNGCVEYPCCTVITVDKEFDSNDVLANAHQWSFRPILYRRFKNPSRVDFSRDWVWKMTTTLYDGTELSYQNYFH